MFSVIIGNSMYFPHGRESTDNQLCIKRKGIFFLVVVDFLSLICSVRKLLLSNLPILMLSVIPVKVS